MLIDTGILIDVLLALAVALIISFLATLAVKAFAYKVGAIDVPKEARRVHDHPIPRLGGLAIFLGFILSVVLFVDIDKQAEEMFSRLIKQMAEHEGVTEKLKADNQMKWVVQMNNIRSRAAEIVNNDLIYT